MSKLCAIAVAACLPLSASAREGKLATPSSEIGALARFKAPKGWSATEDRLGGDSVVSFALAPYAIRVQLLGGKGSRHATPGDFLDSLEAKGQAGKPAAVVRKAKVAGSEVPVYSRSYKFSFSDPHGAAGGEEMVQEEFCVVPVPRGGFFVLSYSMSGPDSGGSISKYQNFSGHLKDWITFLSSFKPVQ